MNQRPQKKVFNLDDGLKKLPLHKGIKTRKPVEEMLGPLRKKFWQEIDNTRFD